MSDAILPPADPDDPADVTAAALVDSSEAVASVGWHHRILAHIPPGQFIRYLFVGVFNTAFGYCTFALINFYLHSRNVPASYIFASLLANFINISVAYVGYKFIVFRTKGNYIREWLKAVAVYGSYVLPSLVILPLVVHAVAFALRNHTFAYRNHTLTGHDSAPYIANAILTAFGTLYSFLGHKKVTFAPPTS